MKRALTLIIASAALLLASLAPTGIGLAQSSTRSEKLTAVEVGKMAEGLGYDTKQTSSVEGKETYEAIIKTDEYTFPVFIEVSGSGSYIWLSLYFGDVKPSTKFEAMLRANAEIQPCQFFISKRNGVKMALALENRQVSPQMLRKAIEMLTDRAEAQSAVWKS